MNMLFTIILKLEGYSALVAENNEKEKKFISMQPCGLLGKRLWSGDLGISLQLLIIIPNILLHFMNIPERFSKEQRTFLSENFCWSFSATKI